MQRVGLLGYPLAHSFSPSYFAQKWKAAQTLNWCYQLFEFEAIEKAVQYLKSLDDLEGFNITIPHKKNIIPFLDSIDTAAASIGAVNCVRLVQQKWIGYNTDYIGFKQSFSNFIGSSIDNKNNKALVLGNGGSAAAVFYALQTMGIPFTIVSRQANNSTRHLNTISYETLNETIIAHHTFIINTTPLGTYPNINECAAIPYYAITAQHYAYDLVYNPEETLFLQQCAQQGAQIKNGYDMLALQAEESWKIWKNKK
jgi:shikimate dehydrogenase